MRVRRPTNEELWFSSQSRFPHPARRHQCQYLHRYRRKQRHRLGDLRDRPQYRCLQLNRRVTSKSAAINGHLVLPRQCRSREAMAGR